MLIDTGHFRTIHLSESDRLPADKSALIIVDMSNRFCDPVWMSKNIPTGETQQERGKWFAVELPVVIEGAKVALDAFRSVHAMVVHVITGRLTAEGRELVPYMRERDYDLADTEAMSVIESLAPLNGEVLIRKPASSSFTGTGLDYLLHNAGIEHIVLAGQFGDACVFYTLIQSREYGFKNYWLEDSVLYQTRSLKNVMPPLIGSRWAKLTNAGQLDSAFGRDLVGIETGRPQATDSR